MAHTKELKQLLQKRPNWLPAFQAFENQVSDFSALKDLYDILMSNPNLLKQLNKPVAEYRDINEIIFDYTNLKASNTFKKFYNELPSKLKDQFKDNVELQKQFHILATNLFSLEREQQRMFFRTVSKYNSTTELYFGLEAYIDNIKNGTEFFDLVQKIEKTKNAFLRIVDPYNGVILVRVTSSDAVKELGKGSTWCIADNRKSYRNNYWKRYINIPENDVQYILFDYNYKHDQIRHRIGITVVNGEFSRAHGNTNAEIDMEQHIAECPYIKKEWFQQQEESLTEYYVSKLSGNGEINEFNEFAITHVLRNGFVNKLSQAMSPAKIAKIIPEYFNNVITTPEIANKNLLDIFKIIGDTKFFNYYIPFLYKLTPETLREMVSNGLVLKYTVHLEEILYRYFRGSASEETTNATTEIKTIGGVEYEVTTTTVMKPINQFDIERLLILIGTNPKVVTKKILRITQEINPALYNTLTNLI